MIHSKLWATASASESEESDTDEVVQTEQDRTQTAWAALDSSASEDEKRVVQTADKKRQEKVAKIVEAAREHLRVADYGKVQEDYDEVISHMKRCQLQGLPLPKSTVKVVIELEDYAEAKYRDKVALKSLSQRQSKEFAKLRHKIRKGNVAFQTFIADCREHPSDYETESDDESGSSDESVDGSSDENETSEMDDKGDDIEQNIPDSINEENFLQRLSELSDIRSKKTSDRQMLFRTLRRLVEVGTNLSPNCHLKALWNIISATFDTTVSVFSSLPPHIWMEVYTHINTCVSIVRAHPTTASFEIASEDTKPTPNQIKTENATVLVSVLDRLDEELTRGLQLTDVHTPEYKERLGQSIDLLALTWKLYCYLDSTVCVNEKCNTALRLLEHTYYKMDPLAARMWELVRKNVPASDANDITFVCQPAVSMSEIETAVTQTQTNTRKPSDLVREMAEFIWHNSNDERSKLRSVLHLSYNHSLQNRYHEAKDLVQIGKVSELVTKHDISTQILYNRWIVQLGLCAFRNNLIQEAHMYLSDIYSLNRHKELLAQGISSNKAYDKSVEKEKAEKRRLLPFHMHISLELLEGVHNICAMLLETPHMASNPFINERKRIISRYFRKMLEQYDRQILTGPPENPRETIMAATKALQKGDWKLCYEYIFGMKIWDFMPNKEAIQQNLLESIKQAALKTHLFAFSKFYVSFSVDHLARMFELPKTIVHSIVSKKMINEAIIASWDESSECILMSQVELTDTQSRLLQLSDRIVTAGERNENLLSAKNPKFFQKDPREFRRGQDEGRYYDYRGAGRGGQTQFRPNPIGAGRTQRGMQRTYQPRQQYDRQREWYSRQYY